MDFVEYREYMAALLNARSGLWSLGFILDGRGDVESLWTKNGPDQNRNLGHILCRTAWRRNLFKVQRLSPVLLYLLICDSVILVTLLNIQGRIKGIELWSGLHSTFHVGSVVYVWYTWGGEALFIFLYKTMHFVKGPENKC